MLGKPEAPKHNPHGQGVFFLLWPLFARALRHWFLENILLSAPGVCKVFFLLRSVGRATFQRGQARAKKNTTQGVFCLLRPRGKAGEGEAPCRHGARAKTPPRENFFAAAPAKGTGTGPEQKTRHHPGCFFFAPAPGKGRGRRTPVGRRHGAKAKKNTTQVFLFFRQ